MKTYVRYMFLLMLSCLLVAEERSLYVAYEKHEGTETSEIAGVFYAAHRGMYLLIDHPVRQWVHMNADHFIYYYPDENMALKMNNPDGTLSTSALQFFMFSDSEDMGLGDAGFALSGHRVSADTLIKTWELKGKSKREYMRLDVFSYRGHVVKAVSGNDQKEIKRVFFSDWLERDHYNYPMTLKIFEENKRSEYYFNDLRILEDIPDSVMGLFTLPEDCKIYEYRW